MPIRQYAARNQAGAITWGISMTVSLPIFAFLLALTWWACRKGRADLVLILAVFDVVSLGHLAGPLLRSAISLWS